MELTKELVGTMRKDKVPTQTQDQVNGVSQAED